MLLLTLLKKYLAISTLPVFEQAHCPGLKDILHLSLNSPLIQPTGDQIPPNREITNTQDSDSDSAKSGKVTACSSPQNKILPDTELHQLLLHTSQDITKRQLGRMEEFLCFLVAKGCQVKLTGSTVTQLPEKCVNECTDIDTLVSHPSMSIKQLKECLVAYFEDKILLRVATLKGQSFDLKTQTIEGFSLDLMSQLKEEIRSFIFSHVLQVDDRMSSFGDDYRTIGTHFELGALDFSYFIADAGLIHYDDLGHSVYRDLTPTLQALNDSKNRGEFLLKYPLAKKQSFSTENCQNYLEHMKAVYRERPEEMFALDMRSFFSMQRFGLTPLTPQYESVIAKACMKSLKKCLPRGKHDPYSFEEKFCKKWERHFNRHYDYRHRDPNDFVKNLFNYVACFRRHYSEDILGFNLYKGVLKVLNYIGFDMSTLFNPLMEEVMNDHFESLFNYFHFSSPFMQPVSVTLQLERYKEVLDSFKEYPDPFLKSVLQKDCLDFLRENYKTFQHLSLECIRCVSQMLEFVQLASSSEEDTELIKQIDTSIVQHVANLPEDEKEKLTKQDKKQVLNWFKTLDVKLNPAFFEAFFPLVSKMIEESPSPKGEAQEISFKVVLSQMVLTLSPGLHKETIMTFVNCVVKRETFKRLLTGTQVLHLLTELKRLKETDEAIKVMKKCKQILPFQEGFKLMSFVSESLEAQEKMLDLIEPEDIVFCDKYTLKQLMLMDLTTEVRAAVNHALKGYIDSESLHRSLFEGLSQQREKTMLRVLFDETFLKDYKRLTREELFCVNRVFTHMEKVPTYLNPKYAWDCLFEYRNERLAKHFKVFLLQADFGVNYTKSNDFIRLYEWVSTVESGGAFNGSLTRHLQTHAEKNKLFLDQSEETMLYRFSRLKQLKETCKRSEALSAKAVAQNIVQTMLGHYNLVYEQECEGFISTVLLKRLETKFSVTSDALDFALTELTEFKPSPELLESIWLRLLDKRVIKSYKEKIMMTCMTVPHLRSALIKRCKVLYTAKDQVSFKAMMELIPEVSRRTWMSDHISLKMRQWYQVECLGVIPELDPARKPLNEEDNKKIFTAFLQLKTDEDKYNFALKVMKKVKLSELRSVPFTNSFLVSMIHVGAYKTVRLILEQDPQAFFETTTLGKGEESIIYNLRLLIPNEVKGDKVKRALENIEHLFLKLLKQDDISSTEPMDANGETALTLAIRMGWLNVIIYICEQRSPDDAYRAELNAFKNGESLLSLASTYESPRVLLYLVNRFPHLVTFKNKLGWDVLDLCCETLYVDNIRLVSSCPQINPQESQAVIAAFRAFKLEDITENKFFNPKAQEKRFRLKSDMLVQALTILDKRGIDFGPRVILGETCDPLFEAIKVGSLRAVELIHKKRHMPLTGEETSPFGDPLLVFAVEAYNHVPTDYKPTFGEVLRYFLVHMPKDAVYVKGRNSKSAVELLKDYNINVFNDYLLAKDRVGKSPVTVTSGTVTELIAAIQGV